MWEVVWIKYCGWTWIPEDTSTQVISECIKYKNWMCEKSKTTVLFMWKAAWRTDSNISLLLIMPGRNCAIYGCSSSRATLTRVSLYRSNNGVTLVVVIDDNLKRKIKNWTLHICTLFLLTWIFQYIGNSSKILKTLPTLFLQYT